jgi:hypothetical protein
MFFGSPGASIYFDTMVADDRDAAGDLAAGGSEQQVVVRIVCFVRG